jgi:probable rRNA maturation factor
MTATDDPDPAAPPRPARRAPVSARPAAAVDVSVPFDAWKTVGFDAVAAARRAVREALAGADLPARIRGRALEVSVLLANDDLIRTLNRTYRGKDAPTNVLSFPLLSEDEPLAPEGPVALGDIVVSFETLRGESHAALKRFADHMTHLVVHGTLHLVGYDHEDEDDADRMEEREIMILGRMGLTNPYA